MSKLQGARSSTTDSAVSCPECGRNGTLTGRLAQVGTGTGLIELSGLDLDGCDGCRNVARDRGFVAISKTPGPVPGTFTVRLAQPDAN